MLFQKNLLKNICCFSLTFTTFLQHFYNISTTFLQHFYNISTTFLQHFYNISTTLSQHYKYKKIKKQNIKSLLHKFPLRNSFLKILEKKSYILKLFDITANQPQDTFPRHISVNLLEFFCEMII